MKKILTVLLALAMCLSLCACGSAGNNGGNFLTKSEWKDIGNKESTLTFNPNGTGIFEGRDMTWAQTDQKLSISYQGSARMMTIEFDVIEAEAFKMLIECPNDIAGTMIFVSSDNYENSCQLAQDYMVERADILDWDSMYMEILENSARAAANHNGKIVKWSAKVYDIYGDSCQMAIKQSGSTPVNSIFVYMGTDELIKFNKFDEITIVGVLEIDDHYYQIGGAFVVETK